jgi:hypothetical protein
MRCKCNYEMRKIDESEPERWCCPHCGDWYEIDYQERCAQLRDALLKTQAVLSHQTVLGNEWDRSEWSFVEIYQDAVNEAHQILDDALRNTGDADNREAGDE